MRCIVLVLLIARVIMKADADCDVVPMTQWAEEATYRKTPLANPLELVIVQHSGAPDISDSATDEECEKAAKAIRNYHLTKIKFDDIGMNFLVCNNGKVYEGAGWQLVGAHTRYYNDKSLGMSFIGNYTSKLPSRQALKAAMDLLACGVQNNHLTEQYRLVGHRQLTQTQSPGDTLQKEVENWPHWTNIGQR